MKTIIFTPDTISLDFKNEAYVQISGDFLDGEKIILKNEGETVKMRYDGSKYGNRNTAPVLEVPKPIARRTAKLFIRALQGEDVSEDLTKYIK